MRLARAAMQRIPFYVCRRRFGKRKGMAGFKPRKYLVFHNIDLTLALYLKTGHIDMAP